MPAGPRHPKSHEARTLEVRHLTSQLESQIMPDDLRRPILEDLREFEDTGQGFSKLYRVPGLPLRVFCLVSGQAHITSHARVFTA